MVVVLQHVRRWRHPKTCAPDIGHFPTPFSLGTRLWPGRFLIATLRAPTQDTAASAKRLITDRDDTMFNGFRLTMGNSDPFARWAKRGRDVLESTWPAPHRRLDKFISTGVLDGDAIREKWFGKTDAHVFISHSHDDEAKAIGLAGFLHQELGLLPFVDSLIWGDSRKLLRRIDEEHCRNKAGTGFDYQQRNYSTSHVHMMLATSLTAAMDSCEALMFMDTPKSISIADANSPELGKVATASPWIYHELMTSTMLRRKPDPRRFPETASVEMHTGVVEARDPYIANRAPVAHLIPLTASLLLHCRRARHTGFDALDWLYALPAPEPVEGRETFSDYLGRHGSRLVR
ncbi:hypothetical protein KPL74_08850 [Bacillus sp. NP157]|nr:hypothetical protein KPL74_08850 [Bacillus sp. NP157]